MSGRDGGAEQRLVTPGEVIAPVGNERAGSGCAVVGSNVVATRLGTLTQAHNTWSVQAFSTSYFPRSGDLVIGTVEAVQSNLWFVDIHGPFNGLLPMSLAPFKAEYGAARMIMGPGAVILARVQEVDATHAVILTMKGVGLRRLKRGITERIPVQHLDVLRGDEARLDRIRDLGSARILMGENGVVWVDGKDSDLVWIRRILAEVRAHGHAPDALTRIDEMIEQGPGGA